MIEKMFSFLRATNAKDHSTFILFAELTRLHQSSFDCVDFLPVVQLSIYLQINLSFYILALLGDILRLAPAYPRKIIVQPDIPQLFRSEAMVFN
jgi:hypothetical protein